MPALSSGLTEDEISRRLAKALRRNPPSPQPEFPTLPGMLSGPPRAAAVLVPLLCENGVWQLLFTRRTANLPEHSGQVAFPGGRAEPQDASLEQTALRETQEEIGVRPEDVRILGRLQEFITVTNYRVTPIVGVMPWPYPLRLERDEVVRAFTIPLDWLADRANYEERQRPLPSPHGHATVIYYQLYDGELLWGATARFTLAFLEAIT